MSEDIAKKIQNYIEKMPSLPVTVTKILEICNNPATSPVDLNQVISLDPVLMARVLKLINSAYYGVSTQVTSLVRAIIMLGLNTVKNLALSTAVMGTLGKKEDFKSLNMQGFWLHSLSTGVICKAIARHRKIDPKNLEEYFIAGLLHDIGKIPLNTVLDQGYMQAIASSDMDRVSLQQKELELFGLDHTQSGTLIAQTWKLSGVLQDVIRYHHDPAGYQGEHGEMVFMVSVANRFAHLLEMGFSGNRHPASLPNSVFQSLGINPALLDSLEETIGEEIGKAKVFLNMTGQ